MTDDAAPTDAERLAYLTYDAQHPETRRWGAPDRAAWRQHRAAGLRMLDEIAKQTQYGNLAYVSAQQVAILRAAFLAAPPDPQELSPKA